MKPIWLAIIFIAVLSLVALFSIIKFATEVSDNQEVKMSADTEDFSIPEKLVLRVSTNSGVVRTQDNHSYVASQRYPYIAAVLAQRGAETFSFTCFGSVILMKWIVTAAHCKKPGHSHRILLFYDYVRNRTRTHAVVQWRVHEGYRANNTFPWHDIAVAKVAVNVEPAPCPAVFTGTSIQQVQAGIWKTLMTMDRITYLSNNMDIYDVAIVDPPRCYEQFGILMDESLICVDMSQHDDCFVTEFGPIFTSSERAVGVLAMKPKECESKVAVFTNVSSYYHWILQVTSVT